MMTFHPGHPTTPTPPAPAPASAPAWRAVERRLEVFTADPRTELTDMATRLARLRELDIHLHDHEDLDALADTMSERAGFRYAMVNAFGEEQTFIGLRNPPREAGYALVGRTMSRGHGYCPEVVQRRLGLPLPNVAASPRYASNHVCDAIGIQSYFGEPVIDAATGLVLATVCVIDTEPRTLDDARRLQAIVKDGARAAADLLHIPTPLP
ncbi:GAF domain-containing protein (plasmid) [Streptomyces sp. NBC_00080]|uniref:GAF domain-containing protein n=1 Tax=unclassified Streptomyces TaxID=2593676 RepID=UPI0011708031|nr:GAF domain-containing protein [Streptomyces sp. SLBN-115]TQJ37972.1 GAF domain-containing protein [Streptomyces sp. SLBN-115]